MEAILDAGLPYVSGPQWLYENVLRDKWVLAVAGTHGKTTTTAMLAWILDHAGLRPGLSDRRRAGRLRRLGAADRQRVLRDRGRRIRHGVLRQALEVRPLPAAHRDPQQPRIRSRRHLSRPGGDRDAVPSFRAHDSAAAAGSSSTAARRASRACSRAAAGARSSASALAGRCRAPGPDWTIAVDGAILLGGAPQGTLRFGELGRHNQLNALAAIAAARHAGVPVAQASRRSPNFGGVKRRLELRGTVRGITVYDDFAHHPTAIATTLDGLRRKVGGARILAVLEPRSNTMKLGAMKDALPGSLAAADRVFCYAANLGWDAPRAGAARRRRSRCHDDLDALVAAIVARSARRRSRAGDEQRRLRRRPREAAGATRGAAMTRRHDSSIFMASTVAADGEGAKLAAARRGARRPAAGLRCRPCIIVRRRDRHVCAWVERKRGDAQR